MATIPIERTMIDLLDYWRERTEEEGLGKVRRG
jgi:hypothetical protein